MRVTMSPPGGGDGLLDSPPLEIPPPHHGCPDLVPATCVAGQAPHLLQNESRPSGDLVVMEQGPGFPERPYVPLVPLFPGSTGGLEHVACLHELSGVCTFEDKVHASPRLAGPKGGLPNEHRVHLQATLQGGIGHESPPMLSECLACSGLHLRNDDGWLSPKVEGAPKHSDDVVGPFG